MSDAVYLGIDLGTQSVRAMAVNQDGVVLEASTQRLISERDGVRHEQDPETWWLATANGLREDAPDGGSRQRQCRARAA